MFGLFGGLFYNPQADVETTRRVLQQAGAPIPYQLMTQSERTIEEFKTIADLAAKQHIMIHGNLDGFSFHGKVIGDDK